MTSRIRFAVVISCFILAATRCAHAQPTIETLWRQSAMVASQEILEEHRRFLASHLPSLSAEEAADWNRAAPQLRAKLLNRVVFRGVPIRWRPRHPTVVWGDTIHTPHGYRIRKLRFQALPGVWIPALLYEPDKFVSAAVPVVLNLNGHVATGKATDYKQLRCINLVKRGMIAMNVEWIGMGQLRTPGWSHNHLAKLDICGRSGLSVFYLAMSRALDVLLDHSHADSTRVAVTGLSGGGWQTIILSALDPRVTVSVPVAGYSSVLHRLEHPNSIGDLEQLPNDLTQWADYTHLNALVSPRPLLMIYNARDDCCFVADDVKPTTYTPVVPFYAQADADDDFQFYVNSEPGTHNFERDNRQQLYSFLARYFSTNDHQEAEEIPSEDERLSATELHVPLPQDNGDFNTLAQQLASTLPKSAGRDRAELRCRLRNILRLPEYEITAARFPGATESDRGLDVRPLRLSCLDHWSVPAVMVGDTDSPAARAVVLLADDGWNSHLDRIQELAASGAWVLAVDPILIGHAQPDLSSHQSAMMLASVGARPLGIRTAQLIACASFLGRVGPSATVRVEAHGPRSGLVARCAAALDPHATIVKVTASGELESLRDLLEPKASFEQAPECYCFGLLEYFDIPLLMELARAND